MAGRRVAQGCGENAKRVTSRANKAAVAELLGAEKGTDRPGRELGRKGSQRQAAARREKRQPKKGGQMEELSVACQVCRLGLQRARICSKVWTKGVKCRARCEREHEHEGPHTCGDHEDDVEGACRIKTRFLWPEIKSCREAGKRTVRRLSANPERLTKGQILNKMRREACEDEKHAKTPPAKVEFECQAH